VGINQGLLRSTSSPTIVAAASSVRRFSSEAEYNPVIWQSSTINPDFNETERILNVGAFATGSGLGFALLGVAPFTAPNPFMIGLLLAIVQVRLAHAFMVRQMRSQVRRHVETIEVVKGPLVGENGEKVDSAVVKITCGGGLIRTLHLGPETSDKRPPLKDVLGNGKLWLYLDKSIGGEPSDATYKLDDFLNSELGIQKEEVRFTSLLPEENEALALATIQELPKMDAEQLKKLEGKEVPGPRAAFGTIQQGARVSTLFILVGGGVICVGGRYSADRALAEHSMPQI